MAVEQLVDAPFEAADLAERLAVLVDECLEPFEPVSAGGGRARGGVAVFQAAQAALDLAAAVELVADLGGLTGTRQSLRLTWPQIRDPCQDDGGRLPDEHRGRARRLEPQPESSPGHPR